uniref:Putative ovule protein n=1 Tax=Solanum chacoense TaxID=4108 RepID=A0A0V0GIV1_SOLCH
MESYVNIAFPSTSLKFFNLTSLLMRLPASYAVPTVFTSTISYLHSIPNISFFPVRSTSCFLPPSLSIDSVLLTWQLLP